MCKSLVSAGAKRSRGPGGNPPLWDTAAGCPFTGKEVFSLSLLQPLVAQMHNSGHAVNKAAYQEAVMHVP